MKMHFAFFLMMKLSLMMIHLETYSQASVLCDSGKIYEQSCNGIIIVTRKDSLQKIGEYKASIQNCLEILKDDDAVEKDQLFYRLSVSYANLNQIDSAAYFLDRYIDVSQDDRVIIVDKDFDVLRKDTLLWKHITTKIEQRYLQELDSTVNKELALRLFYMGIEDQKYRVYLNTLGQLAYDSNGRFRILMSMKEINELEIIINEYGFPTISMVGRLGSLNAFLILQHSDRIVRNYRHVKRIYKQNEIGTKEFAMLTDRRLMDLNRKQLYGTQLIQNLRTKRKYQGKYVLYPVKDFENVNQRRKEMGFNSTVEEYVASWKNENYVIPTEYYKKASKK